MSEAEKMRYALRGMKRRIAGRVHESRPQSFRELCAKARMIEAGMLLFPDEEEYNISSFDSFLKDLENCRRDKFGDDDGRSHHLDLSVRRRVESYCSRTPEGRVRSTLRKYAYDNNKEDYEEEVCSDEEDNYERGDRLDCELVTEDQSKEEIPREMRTWPGRKDRYT